MKNITILGAGSMGTAVAMLLSDNKHKVRVWSPFDDEIDMLNRYNEHITKLPGVKIDQEVLFTTDIERALANSSLIVCVLPSEAVSSVLRKISGLVDKNNIIAGFTKGLEESTGYRISQIFNRELPGIPYVAMSGPCHAEELSRKIPTAYVAAHKDFKISEYVRDIFMNSYFRVYTNRDVTGVELGGALKNVVALCAGISDGLGYGDNTKAALMTRAIAEISRLGSAEGASAETFLGLAGIGDLIVTCTSIHSRNRKAGLLIGQGHSVEEAVKMTKMVVEGIKTSKAAYNMAKKMNIEMPIVSEAYNVLFLGKNPDDAVKDLMTRDKTSEMHGLFDF